MKPEKASFWSLAFAYLIDFVLLRFLIVVVAAVAAWILRAFGFKFHFIALLLGGFSLLASLLVNTLYFAWLESTKQASLGKFWLDIKVYKA